jgi:hypothetical protein
MERHSTVCRLLIKDQTLELASPYELPIRFLPPELALPKLSVGKSVTLREGQYVATGKVVRLENDASPV